MILRSKTFLRYVLSYALILFLPLLVLFFTFYSTLMGRFTEEITQSNTRALTQVQESFDKQLEQIIHLSYLIQNNSDLQPSSIGSDIIAARSAVSTLSTYKSITTLPELIMVCAENGDVLYTNTGVLSLAQFFDQQYVYSHYTVQDFRQALAHPASIVTWGSDRMTQYGGQTGEYITLFIAVQRGNLSPKVRSVYIIPVKRLQQAIEGVASEYGGHVYIFDQHGSMIMTDQSAPLPDDVDIRHIEPELQQRLTTDGGDYFLTTVQSKIVGWRYVYAVSAAAVEAPLHRILVKMILAMVFICLLGGVAVYRFSLRQYRPLHQLRQQALAYAPVGHGSEVEQVSAALTRLSQDSDDYRRRLENSRDALAQSCLARLLRGRGDRGQLIERAKENGIDLTEAQQYTIAAMVFSEETAAASIPLIRNALASESFGFADAILCENPPDSSQLALLIPDADGETDWKMRLFPLQDYLQSALSCEVAFGVSRPMPVLSLAEAYTQAATALNDKFILGGSCIAVCQENAGRSKGQTYYPLQDLETLQWNLLQLDAEATTRCIHAIMEGITKSSPPFPVARMICFDVLNVTLHSLYSMSDDASVHPTDSMLEQLAGFNTIRELTALLEELIKTACESIRQMRKGDGDERVQWIRKYVEDNCFDPDFSIYTTADHFGLTPSNLSHYFKNLTGESISDYVQALRRAEACRMLTQTDASVQDIGQRIGMLNVSSFIRRFKQQTGLTPGQYRNLYSKGALEKEDGHV